MPTAPKPFTLAYRQSRATVEKSWQSRRNGNHAFYNLWIWRKPNSGIRALVLKRDPLCVECLKKNLINPSTQADHKEPHKGDYQKFIDLENLQGLCVSCHSSKTVKEQQ